jgi:hypothetical protein
MNTMKTTRGAALSADDRQELVRLIDTQGMDALRNESGLSRTAILNAATGLPVIPGTRRLVEDLLETFADADESEDEADGDALDDEEPDGDDDDDEVEDDDGDDE